MFFPTTTTKNKNQVNPINTAVSYVILLGGGYLFYRLIQNQLKAKIKEKKNEQLFEQEQNKNKKLTYKPSQYIAFADKIEDACNGTIFNPTDEEAIYKVMYYLHTNDDWLELNKAFGIRKYYATQLSTGEDKNMQQFLQGDLDTQEKSKVNKILAQNGIKYRI
ncbi:hypothetical protein EBR66_07295 [bacterium]|nr:hypothetical protein [bacterium]